MSMFDGILGNLDDIAAKVGIPADQVKSVTDMLGSKMADGGTSQMAALVATAQAHGLSVDKLQEMLGHGGVGDMVDKATAFLDKDGDGNPLNDLGGFAKGLFG